MSSGNMFSVYGRMTALPGRRDELIAVVVDGLRAGGDDSGLLTYSINTAFDDPDTLWLTQLWIDKEAHDATTRSEPAATPPRSAATSWSRAAGTDREHQAQASI